MLGFYQHFSYGCFCWLSLAYITAGITLSVLPSSKVTVNQSVTLLCELDTYLSLPFNVSFVLRSPSFTRSTVCTLELGNWGCLYNTPYLCMNLYDAACLSTTRYSIQVNVPSTWSGASVLCRTFNETSNSLVFFVQESVSSVTLSSTTTTLISGQQMNLTCATSYCNPPAYITWYKSSENVTNQSNYTINRVDGLAETVSLLVITVGKNDTGKRIFCRASNTPGKTVSSNISTLNVLYKPEVTSGTLRPYKIREGQTATLSCTLTDANPYTDITWRWFKTDSPNNVLHNGSVFTISNIQRRRSGTYNCSATNVVGTSENATIEVDVLYKPEVTSGTLRPYKVREGQTTTLNCTVTDANPYTDITWRWIKTDSPNNVLHNGSVYTISNIQRRRSGTYNCSATNVVGTSENATVEVDVLYKPEVTSGTPSPYRVREGDTASLSCTVTDANPYTDITWTWFKSDSPNNVLHNGSVFTISNIQRGRSRTYNCSARNVVGTSENAAIEVDVLYKPSIERKGATVVNENDVVNLTREISSNPLSNASWYNGSKLLVSELAVNTTTLVIHGARCTDTKNFTLTASNSLQWNVRSLVELIVNCKPSSEINNITLGVSDDTGFAFSTTIIAYPKPHYVLLAENRRVNYEIVHSMAVNAVNIFTIHFSKTTVEQGEYGTFAIYINNTFGGTSIFVNVIPQREPTAPRIVEVICQARSAKVQWMSSFNGGNSQTFIVHAFLAQQEGSRSEPMHDEGENKLHNTQIQNIQPSTKYTFYVVARNKYGNSSSDKMICNTSEEIYTSYVPIVGGSLAGTVLLVALILITVFLIHRRYTCACEINFGKRNRKKTGEANEESLHYTAMAEQENTERNVYDELNQNHSEYEEVLMEERGVNNAKMYENIGSTDKQVPSEDQSNVLCTTGTVIGSYTTLPEQNLAGTTGVYINTSFMN